MHKPIEIFCGTGGVGKTTLATSRALFLSSQGKKVLLITIDPAKRLKQILKMKDEDAGEIASISPDTFEGFDSSFDALLMNPSSTIQKMGEANNTFKELDNRIVKVLTKPYGGMNEIMAIIEVQFHLKAQKYDTIILDTPPGKHFIDFLSGSQKIKHFFDKSFIEIFRYLGKSFGPKDSGEKKGFFGKIVKSGVNKLLSYLEKVTGETFVEEFVDAIIGLYKNKDSFLMALDFQEDLKKEQFSNWFLVTSVEQHKIEEASELQAQAQGFMHKDSFLAINKCLGPYIEKWEKETPDSDMTHLRNTMRDRENKLKEFAGKGYQKVLPFPEVFHSAPANHVSELAKSWSE
ncbi:MAG: AAA family ATPase [Oligoflexia bacterium]|nr:AAA family ATPase [Oligoflexia bacterium]